MTKKEIDKLIEKTFNKYSNGVQISVLDICKIFDEARKEITNGNNIDLVIQSLIAKYRVN